MRALIQRVSSASVAVEGLTVSSIGRGLLVFLGVVKGDTEADLEYLAAKISNLRIFEDDNGRMNLSALDISGEILLVSQFTLCADTRRGNRPSFTDAEEPVRANVIYQRFVDRLRECGMKTQTGVFSAHMEVFLTNDGPVTIIMDSKDKAA